MYNTNPFDIFNELISTGDKSYFKDPIKALCPLDDQQELNNIGNFQEMLYLHNSSKIFDKMGEAIWKNSPVVFVPKNEFHPDVIDELIDAKFDVALSKMYGLYITFPYRPYANCGNFTIGEMFTRAFTTRSSLPGIFHRIFTDLVNDIDSGIGDVVEYYPRGDYINLEIVKRIVSMTTNFPTQIKDKKLIITWNPLPENISYFFTSIVSSSKEQDSYYDQLLQAATERKHNTKLYCSNINMRNMVFKALQSDGFVCEKDGSQTIKVEWGNCESRPDILFSHTCWIRYNTVNYYRVCASTVTRALRQSPSDKAIILPAPTKPIDEAFFIEFFNQRQAHRCEPIVVNELLKLKYIVSVKHEYVEKLKAKAYTESKV